MRTIQRPHAAVIKRGRNPGRFIVTHGTIGRESGSFMIGVRRSIIISLVTTDAGVGRIVVIPVVTCCTVIRNIGMRSQ